MSGERYDKGVETRRVLQVSWMSWDMQSKPIERFVRKHCEGQASRSAIARSAGVGCDRASTLTVLASCAGS